jgi:hypothetical protein
MHALGTCGTISVDGNDIAAIVIGLPGNPKLYPPARAAAVKAEAAALVRSAKTPDAKAAAQAAVDAADKADVDAASTFRVLAFDIDGKTRTFDVQEGDFAVVGDDDDFDPDPIDPEQQPHA